MDAAETWTEAANDGQKDSSTEMRRYGEKPNAVIFVALVGCCALQSMGLEHGIEPIIEHL
ncbi:hypothetical protein E2562_036878 [Oryza meyeriana var. granulata]|uniref:Uncharacterized protein n=1 Tax=Oryza meyeriana var. granulata TaxID=110450 RepID=A0A6G1CXB5_9ORYZ|nr:hypothetical protein E2562_036878 [Oryza meyeriana var. granulata]